MEGSFSESNASFPLSRPAPGRVLTILSLPHPLPSAQPAPSANDFKMFNVPAFEAVHPKQKINAATFLSFEAWSA